MIFSFIQNIDTISAKVNSDSLNMVKTAIQDTVQQVSEKSLGDISFDFSKIAEGNGELISVVSMAVVFSSLALLSIFLIYLTKTLQLSVRKKREKTGEITPASPKAMDSTGEIDAAIFTALHLHFSELHDLENTVLTINKVQRVYSPWSSKIYGLRNIPRK